MVTELLNDVFDGLATSRPPERLTDEVRGRAHANAPLEDPRLEGRTIGNSSGWRAVLEAARRVGSTETTVCLSGESGTGKEVVARFIHAVSPRRRGPFMAINCAALPEQLLESELFGFERGAFTDAHHAKPGQIELAAAGVLFLDEISEMSPAAQAKFLRVLQEREFLRLGGTRPVKADIRVIVATNRHLPDAIAQGRFRADLYYRVSVFDIRIPPLRERRDDITVLADSFLRELSDGMGRPVMELTTAARELLLSYDWPGNVRELRNVLERATIVCEDGLIRADDLSIAAAPDHAEEKSTDLAVVERRIIQQVMRETAGNKARAAQHLGISRTQLYVRLRKYGLAV
jgi:transcriptional regulator with PAS, ATPase and Fis domain